MFYRRWSVIVAAAFFASCNGGSSPTNPSPPVSTSATVRFAYVAATAIRPDLPPSAASCVLAETPTHVHVSWRNFQGVNMTAVGTNRWEAVFTDVPVNARHLLALSDPNACDENPTGSVTRDIFANDVRLSDVQPVPNRQPMVPAVAFTVSADGRVTP